MRTGFQGSSDVSDALHAVDFGFHLFATRHLSLGGPIVSLPGNTLECPLCRKEDEQSVSGRMFVEALN